MTNDPTAGALEMQLNRETNEWLERSRRRQDAEAKRDL